MRYAGHPMASSGLRITLSGPVGAGKTTLGKALAGRLGLPFIPENYTGIYNTHAAGKKIIRDPLAGSARKQEVTRALMETFFSWLKEREKLYREYPGFVADRWEADTLDLWLKFFSNSNGDEQTRIILKRLREVGDSLSFSILLPPGEFRADQRNEDGMKRRQSFNLTLQAYIMTGGLIRQCRNLPVLELTAERQTVEERLENVLRFIREKFPNARIAP